MELLQLIKALDGAASTEERMHLGKQLVESLFPRATLHYGNALLRETRQRKDGLFPARTTPGCREIDIREFHEPRTIELYSQSWAGSKGPGRGVYGNYKSVSHPCLDMEPNTTAEIVWWSIECSTDTAGSENESSRWARWIQATWITADERLIFLDPSTGNPFWDPVDGNYFPVECTFCKFPSCSLRIAGYAHSDSDHLFPRRILNHPAATAEWKTLASDIISGRRDMLGHPK